MTTSTASIQTRTLSWKEARGRLRRSLEAYLETSVKKAHRPVTTSDASAGIVCVCRNWRERDLDIFLGSFGTSLSLLVIVISVIVLVGVEDEQVANAQLTGSCLIVLTCILNMWLIARYRSSTVQGNDTLKRRMISRFLNEMKNQEDESMEDDSGSPSRPDDNGIDLVGTSLTAIYPVYRLSQDRDGNIFGASWSRIPSLLLVHGDRIALQIGDIAPASCRTLEGDGDTNVTFERGQKVSLESYNQSAGGVVSSLAKGRTTIPAGSDELLNLCHNMQVFEVLETPLDLFLREPEHESKSPQLFRQLQAVRGILSITAIVTFALTLAIMFARYDQFATDLIHFLPTPFLAALGALPLIGPSCLIFVESLGSARIMASYHPVASRMRHHSIKAGPIDTNVDLLILRYFLAICSNRLSLQSVGRNLDKLVAKRGSLNKGNTYLVRVPPASLNLLYKLGVATAFALIDDELVCEPQAIPQQLLIPSSKGLKLLDLCPKYDSDDDGEESQTSLELRRYRQRSLDGDQNYDSDSDSDDALKDHHRVPSRNKPRRRLLRKSFGFSSRRDKDEDSDAELDHEVQFEDPSWWQHLPSLKCIGLACLLADQKDEISIRGVSFQIVEPCEPFLVEEQEYHCCKTALVDLVCKERRSLQLRSMAHCIGFSTKSNAIGPRGDLSRFTEKHRLHVISAGMMKQRLNMDFHERGSEESRWWGFLRADSTAVIVQDSHSGSYQLFSVGDPRVVLRATHEAWQGENSTILPLSSSDRKTILETSDTWKLADLDVEAFSYTPIPQTFEACCQKSRESKYYLLDNDQKGEKHHLPILKDKGASAEWSLLQNQIFLGVLGSLVIPRSETQGLLSTLQDAGVRFVYFSPRNMRRQKEIASQMGIDVAWNCAISLRPLDHGEEDPHRMVSNYADWDVNAKLPHGIESVKRHLKDVDNVPLLVSLFTDVTKTTTKEMIEIFQEYNDTVVAVGLSHLPGNSKIFSTADLAIGVDVLNDCIQQKETKSLQYNSLLPSEVYFASTISSHSCAFRLRGIRAMEHMPTILAQGRASLEGATCAAIMLLTGYLSFSFYVLLTVCSVSVLLPYVPVTGAVLYLLIIIPLVGIPIVMSDLDKFCMQQVPPKNDGSVDFGRREGKTFYSVALLKALPPAVFPQLLYLIALGEFLIEYELDLVHSLCSSSIGRGDWASVIRCSALIGYSGVTREYAVVFSLAELALCVTVMSASLVHRTLPMWVEPPWRRNHLWSVAVLISVLVLVIYLLLSVDRKTFSVLPWYFYILAMFMPLLCLVWSEILKRPEKIVLDRAEKLRRLQFETRLGMWSPK